MLSKCRNLATFRKVFWLPGRIANVYNNSRQQAEILNGPRAERAVYTTRDELQHIGRGRMNCSGRDRSNEMEGFDG